MLLLLVRLFRWNVNYRWQHIRSAIFVFHFKSCLINCNHVIFIQKMSTKINDCAKLTRWSENGLQLKKLFRWWKNHNFAFCRNFLYDRGILNGLMFFYKCVKMTVMGMLSWSRWPCSPLILFPKTFVRKILRIRYNASGSFVS